MCWVNFPPVTGGGSSAAVLLGWAFCLTAWLLLSSVAASAAPGQPITDVGVDVVFDFDGDAETDATYEHIAHNSPQPPREAYYTIAFFLRNTSPLRFVRAAAQRSDFQPDEVISSLNAVYVSPGDDNYVGMLTYDAEQMFGQWTFYDTTIGSKNAFYRNKTEVFVGFRLTSLEVGTKHHGWIRFTRPDSHFTTPFAVAGYDWNPLPNEPIGAGLPPVIPVQSAFTSEGQLRLQWPAEVANWVLESCPTLGPDAVWEPVPDVVGTEHLLAPPDTDRFYRLRRP